MDPDEWNWKVEQAAKRWESRIDEIPLAKWQQAATARADRVGSWHRMTRRQRAIARVKGRVRRIIRAIRGDD